MPKFEVYIHKVTEYTVTVEAEDEGSAEEAGLKAVTADPQNHLSDQMDFEVIEAIELEPLD